MGINGKAENPEPFLEIKLPDRCIPVAWSTFELLRAPDVVDQNIDVTVRTPDVLRQAHDLAGIEMVDNEGDAFASQRCDELSGLLYRLGAVVV